LKNLLIITPVKNSIETAQKAISKVCQAKGKAEYLVYNDFSLSECRQALEENQKLGYTLINIEEQVNTPSPNYRFTLIDARKKAVEKKAALIIVESDVYVKPDTFENLCGFAEETADCGMAAAITVDENGTINFPYKHIKPGSKGALKTKHRLSFCCTLLSFSLLQKLDFEKILPPNKHWFDVTISRSSRQLGFNNYVLCNIPVVHLPHGSRPWKQLKYTKPLKYYLKKWIKGLDKI
jgi:hypothetical protein